MPTTVTNTIRSSGGDYTTLSAWEAAEQADIVSADEAHVAECYDDWSTGLADTCVVAGWTTDSTRFVTIKAAAGHEGNGQVPDTAAWSGFYMKDNPNGGVIEIDQAYTVVEDIGLFQTQTSLANPAALYISSNGGNTRIRRVAGRSTEDRVFRATPSDWKFQNCIAYLDGDAGSGFALASTTDSGMEVFNCAAINYNSTGSPTGFNNGTPVRDIDIRNSYSYGCTTSFSSGGFDHASSTNNAADDAATNTPPGSNPITTNLDSADFTDAANDDYTLASGSTLIDAGADLSSIFTQDIVRATRGATFDVGPFEFVAAGGTSLTPNDTSQSQTSEAAALTQHNVLGVNDTGQGQTSEAAALTQHHSISMDDTAQSQVSDAAALTQHNSLAADDSAQSQASESPGITQHHQLGADDSSQAQTSATVTVTPSGQLVATDTSQSQTSDGAVVTQHHQLTVTNTSQVQTSEGVVLSVQFALTIVDTIQSQASDTVTLTEFSGLMALDTSQTQGSDQAALIEHALLSVLDTLQQQTSDPATLSLPGIALGYNYGYTTIRRKQAPEVLVVSQALEVIRRKQDIEYRFE